MRVGRVQQMCQASQGGNAPVHEDPAAAAVPAEHAIMGQIIFQHTHPPTHRENHGCTLRISRRRVLGNARQKRAPRRNITGAGGSASQRAGVGAGRTGRTAGAAPSGECVHSAR